MEGNSYRSHLKAAYGDSFDLPEKDWFPRKGDAAAPADPGPPPAVAPISKPPPSAVLKTERAEMTLNALLLFGLMIAAIVLATQTGDFTPSTIVVLVLVGFAVIWNAILMPVIAVKGATLATTVLFALSALLLAAAAGAAQGITDTLYRVAIQTLLAIAAVVVVLIALKYAGPLARQRSHAGAVRLVKARFFLNSAFLIALAVATVALTAYMYTQTPSSWLLAVLILTAVVLLWYLVLVPVMHKGHISLLTLILLGASAAALVVAAGLTSQETPSELLVGVQSLLGITGVVAITTTLWFYVMADYINRLKRSTI